MFVALIILHVFICLLLIGAVLMQSGRGGGLAGAFGGGGGSQAIFGGRGAATFLSKATTMLGTGFMLTSLILAFLSTQRMTAGKTALEREAEKAATEAPATPPEGEGGPGGLPVPQGEPGPGGQGPGGGLMPPEGTPPPGQTPPAGQTPPGGQVPAPKPPPPGSGPR